MSVRSGLPRLLLPMSPGSGNLLEELLIILEKAGESSGVEIAQWNKISERKKVYRWANNLEKKILNRLLRFFLEKISLI